MPITDRDIPLVVKKRRNKNIGGVRTGVGGFELQVDIGKQTKADIEFLLRYVFTDEVQKQIDIDNPPSAVLLDDRPGKQLDQLRKKGVAIHGNLLQAALLRDIESALAWQINQLGLILTGELYDVRANWGWTLLAPGLPDEQISYGQAARVGVLTRGSALILKPLNVGHAAVANQHLPQGIGYMRRTVEHVRHMGDYKRQWKITVMFTKKFAVPGEVSAYGTPCIIVQPRGAGDRYSSRGRIPKELRTTAARFRRGRR